MENDKNQKLNQEDYDNMDPNHNTFVVKDFEEIFDPPFDMDSNTDDLRWMEKPSQVVNIYWLLSIFGVIVIAKEFDLSYWIVVVPVFIYIVKWIITYCWWYYFNEKTIQERKGVFSVHTREIHYYRVKSVRLNEPFLMRIFGLSDVILITSDPYIRKLKIHAVFHGREYVDQIKKYVNMWKSHRSLAEHDIHPMV